MGGKVNLCKEFLQSSAPNINCSPVTRIYLTDLPTNLSLILLTLTSPLLPLRKNPTPRLTPLMPQVRLPVRSQNPSREGNAIRNSRRRGKTRRSPKPTLTIPLMKRMTYLLSLTIYPRRKASQDTVYILLRASLTPPKTHFPAATLATHPLVTLPATLKTAGIKKTVDAKKHWLGLLTKKG